MKVENETNQNDIGMWVAVPPAMIRVEYKNAKMNTSNRMIFLKYKEYENEIKKYPNKIIRKREFN